MKKIFSRRGIVSVLLCCVVLFLIHPASAQPLPDDPKVKIGKLSNGLTYYIRKNAEPKNRAVLYLVVKAGSLMETDKQQGLAHFLEHMAFNGTKDFPKNDLISTLQKAGVSFGADLNAYTTFDHTVYQLPIPSDSLELLKTGFNILANWAGSITLDSIEIENERGVIVEEDRQRGKNVTERLTHQMIPVMMKGTRHAERLPIGKMEVIQNFKHEELRQFYYDWYRPNRQAVIAVGDFDPDLVEKYIVEYFSNLKNSSNKNFEVASMPENKELLFKVITDPEYPTYDVNLIYRHKTKREFTVQRARKDLIIEMINLMVAGRIRERTQKGEADFMQGRINYGPYEGGLFPDWEATMFGVSAKSAEELPKALKALVAEGERVAKFGFTPVELSVVKKSIHAGNEKVFKERDKIHSSSIVQKLVLHFLGKSSMISEEFNYELVKQLLEEISLEEINEVARQMMKRENQILAVFGPESAKNQLPGKKQLLAATEEARKNLTSYVQKEVNASVLDQVPEGGKIVNEEKIDTLGITILTLSNGVTVLLKPTDFKNDEILFNSFGAGGFSAADDSALIRVNYVVNISNMGIGELDVSQLRQILAGKTSVVSPYVYNLHHGFAGSTTISDLETALKLVHAHAVHPRVDSSVFTKDMEDYRVYYASRSLSPEAVFADSISVVYTNHSYRHQPLTADRIKLISLQESFEFYKKLFGNSGKQTFVFVGSFNVDSIKSLLATYLGALPVSDSELTHYNTWVTPVKGNRELVVRKGLEDKAAVRLFYHGEFEYSPKSNLNLQALSKVVEYRLVERLREKEGGVYSPSVGIESQKFPTGYYQFVVGFTCATANVEKLSAAVKEEIDKIINEGPSEEDLNKFKAEQRRSYEIGLRTNQFWLSYIVGKWREEEDPLSIFGLEERLNNLSTSDVKAAAAKYLNGENFIKAVLFPEKL